MCILYVINIYIFKCLYKIGEDAYITPIELDLNQQRYQKIVDI